MLDSKSASKSADQGSAMNSTQEETPTIQVDEPIINNSTNEIKVEEIPF